MTDTAHDVDDAPLDAHACIDYPTGCSGPVHYHAVPAANATPVARCDHHWARRLERWESSIERYEDCDVPPDWFDPTIAGESWGDDY